MRGRPVFRGTVHPELRHLLQRHERFRYAGNIKNIGHQHDDEAQDRAVGQRGRVARLGRSGLHFGEPAVLCDICVLLSHNTLLSFYQPRPFMRALTPEKNSTTMTM